MSSTLGLVASTLPFSVVDGPGSRYVLFLQGCNFDCVACHNPSTINLCDSCGVCIDVCPHDALDVDENGIIFHSWLCDRCNLCVEICPSDSSPIVEWQTVGRVIAGLRGVERFISGITVTGGEPTRQPEFLEDLFSAIKTDPQLGRLNTLVDTNGTLSIPGWRRLAPVLDGAMVDLKAFSPELHRRLTGHDNSGVKESIRWLGENHKLAEVRLLVIEGVTDDPTELTDWAGFVAGVDPDVPVRLMGFRHLGTRPAARSWPETTPSVLEEAADVLRAEGLTRVSAEVTSTSTATSTAGAA